MYTINLPDSGRTVVLNLRHCLFDYATSEFHKVTKDGLVLVQEGFIDRATNVHLYNLPDNKCIAHCWAICKHPDNFSKREGRKRAVNNLLRSLRKTGLFTKADRRAIFTAVFPEYS
jgi:hypothetical protein